MTVSKKMIIIVPDKDLLTVSYQAITWTNVALFGF